MVGLPYQAKSLQERAASCFASFTGPSSTRLQAVHPQWRQGEKLAEQATQATNITNDMRFYRW